MCLLPLDKEVLPADLGRHDLRPDAGIGGQQRVVLEVGIITSHAFIEDASSRRLDVVVDVVDPFDVRAETGLALGTRGNGIPDIALASAGAWSPAALTSMRQRMLIGSVPPISIATPSSVARPPMTGLRRTSIAPAFSASPSSDSI
jgi:hypothetical protein